MFTHRVVWDLVNICWQSRERTCDRESAEAGLMRADCSRTRRTVAGQGGLSRHGSLSSATGFRVLAGM